MKTMFGLSLSSAKDSATSSTSVNRLRMLNILLMVFTALARYRPTIEASLNLFSEPLILTTLQKNLTNDLSLFLLPFGGERGL